MTYLRGRRGFSLLELLIALSILIIMTGAASLYLGDILFKSKVTKAKNDMDTFVTAVTLHDAENPTEQLDTGLIGGSPNSSILGNAIVERQTLGALVGTYLLTLPNDPWGGGYKINGYAGYVKSYAADYALSGTSKYDKDILSYYLPENLFLAKVRAEDLNGNTILDTGDEVQLYFSKSVRCNSSTGNVAASAVAYDGTSVASNQTPYGISVLDVHTNRVSERSIVDGNGVDISAIGNDSGADEAYVPSWTAHDLRSFRPGDFDASVTSRTIFTGETILLGEAGGIEGADNLTNRNSYGFSRPSDAIYYASFFSRRLKFWMPTTNESRGSDSANIDVGYEVFIPVGSEQSNYDFHEGYAIWESSQGYSTYKTAGDKDKLYLQKQDISTTRRTLIYKSLVD